MNATTRLFCEYCGTRHSGVKEAPPCCARYKGAASPQPRVLVACCVIQGDRMLWMRRAIDPRRGYWMLPSGFLESGEPCAHGAARELAEETGLIIDARELSFYGIGSLPHMNEVYILYRAMVGVVELNPGDEALEARFFSETDFPWEALAFPTGCFAYRRTYEDIRQGVFGIYLANHETGTIARQF